MTLYHFTSPIHLSKIRETGFIKPASIRNPPGRETLDERRVVSLTTDPRAWHGPAWRTHTAMMPTPRRYLEQAKTLVRIEVEIFDAIPWREFMATEGYPCDGVDVQADVAGNDATWYYCTRPIPVSEFQSIEERPIPGALAKFPASVEIAWTPKGPIVRMP